MKMLSGTGQEQRQNRVKQRHMTITAGAGNKAGEQTDIGEVITQVSPGESNESLMRMTSEAGVHNDGGRSA